MPRPLAQLAPVSPHNHNPTPPHTPTPSRGPDGAREFCRRLADRYIGPNSGAYPPRSPEGRKIREQLALLFSLLPPAVQPTGLIRDVLAGLPPAAGTAAARIFQVKEGVRIGLDW